MDGACLAVGVPEPSKAKERLDHVNEPPAWRDLHPDTRVAIAGMDPLNFACSRAAF